MNSEMPLVSFVIPTHNRAHLLRRCLDTVVNQTYKNVEVIVVNDNSSDNTEQILKEYCARYSFFKYFNSNGSGGNAARNAGVLKAAGLYIAFMDDDDECELFRIEEQMKPVISSNYKYDFVISGLTFYEKGTSKTINYLKPIGSIGFTVRWLIKKELIIKAGLFDIKQPSLQDVEFFWRLKNISNIYFSRLSVVNVSSSPVSITKDPNKMIKGIKRLLELHGNKMDDFERKLWIIGLCNKYASLKDWTSFVEYYNTLDKKKIPFSRSILFLSFHLKTKLLLKLQLMMMEIYMKYKSNLILHTN